jgi:hypothetical protein
LSMTRTRPRPRLTGGHGGLSPLPWSHARLAGRLAAAANERAAARGRARVGQRAPQSLRRAYAYLAATLTAATWWTWISNDGNAVLSALPVRGPRRRLGTLLPTMVAVAVADLMTASTPFVFPVGRLILWSFSGAAVIFQFWRNGPVPLLLRPAYRTLVGELSGSSAIEVTGLAARRAGAGPGFRLALEAVADGSAITIVAAARGQRARLFALSGFRVVKMVSGRGGRECVLLVRYPLA